jgi:hypothetical protein
MKWIDRLAQAVRRGRFTRRDYKAAASWGKCAVSEVPRTITAPDFGGDPSDHELYALGVHFADAVIFDRVGVAVDTYHKIRARARQLREEARA